MLRGTIFNDSRIEAFQHSVVELAGTEVIGGTLSTFADGQIQSISNSIIDGVTIDGNVAVKNGHSLTL